jgi:hypothetical protein
VIFANWLNLLNFDFSPLAPAKPKSQKRETSVLKIPLPVFITTATVGFAAKGFLYASAIYQAARADELQTAGRFEMAMPLVCLALLFIIGKFLRRKLLQ